MDFFWDHIKSLVYETPVPSVEDPIDRISVATERIRDMPGILQNVNNSMQCLCQSRCRNCGGGDRGRVAIYRPFGELRRAKIVLSPVWCSRPTTGVPLAHATMNFVGLDLTASDRWHQTTTTKIAKK
ncbi:hypothetical protein TNCV_718411 [Trichonephila clavipes]|nr:hypothetical protein TNCV_718411 [Trichonephila clavipes]